MIERLWDDPEFDAEHPRRALAETRRWDGDKLAEQKDVEIKCPFEPVKVAFDSDAKVLKLRRKSAVAEL